MFNGVVKYQKSFLALVMFASLVLVFAGLPSEVYAEEELCDCWCGVGGVGAEGAKSIGDRLRDACEAECEQAGKEFIVCTNDMNAKPSANLRCWKKDECEVTDDEGSLLGVWEEEQPSDCQENEHYCLSPPSSMKLGVAIGALEEVEDLSEYINAFYRWLWNAGIIIATVMVMIGGLQYMIGKGVGEVRKGKERIKNAIIGLALLFGAYTILATVNPQIVMMELPGFPKIKQVYWIDEETSCEKLWELGYKLKVDNNEYVNPSKWIGTKLCGDKAEVLEGPEGTGTTVEECYFTTCADVGAGCFFGSDLNKPPTCKKCTDIGPDSTDPPPSKEVCESIKFEKRGSAAEPVYRYCVYSKDMGLSTDDSGVVARGTCALIELDCGASSMNSCFDYDKIKVQGPDQSARLDCVNGPAGRFTIDLDPIIDDPSLLRDICIEDPCRVAPYYTDDGDVIKENCVFRENESTSLLWWRRVNTFWDCQNSSAKQDSRAGGWSSCLDKDGNNAAFGHCPTMGELCF